MHDLDHQPLTLPITDAVYQRALGLAQQQPTPQKATQISNNTLAISVVESYLDLMGIATDRTQTESNNPVIRLCANVADLEVTDLGRLECRPVSSTATICPVPPETWEDRIGYVVVQIAADYQEADLLGFSPIATGDLPLTQLEPMEDLLSHLDQLRRQQAAQTPQEPTLVPLSQWFDGLVSTGWQTIEFLLNQGQLTPAFSFRGGVDLTVLDQPTDLSLRRARVLNWEPPLTLCIEVTPEDQKVLIRLQIYPVGQLYLPSDLELQVVDESDQPFLTAQARDADSYIQIQFRGDLGERFSLVILSGDLRFIEIFVI